ncbi:kinase-associated protein B, putative [Bacillus cereus G9241]|nr:kinase-associated protein B, putative [Bacillus cereus G9241]
MNLSIFSRGVPKANDFFDSFSYFPYYKIEVKNMRETFEIGEIVTGIYKTGKYIGEVTNSRPGSYVVKVLAVLKHPVQGDLHNVKQADVPFFHERRALAFREQTNIPEQMVKKYEGEIPDYTDSLKLALETQMNSFSEDDSPFAVRSLETLEQLKKDYKL